MKIALGLLMTALALLAGACSGGGRPQLTVAAAADLQYAFQELQAPFEAACGCDVVFIFGSSGKFAAQIEEGLPADVFASANADYVDGLGRKGLLLSGSETLYAVGRIVIAVPADSSLEPLDLGLVTDPRVGRVAIANPDHAPYGVAAKEALQAAGLWEAVQPKLVLGENASQTAQFIETGDVALGIIPLSLAVQRGDKLRFGLIDQSLHRPLRQTAAVLARSRHPDLAHQFIGFINGEQGRSVMRKYGFVLPGEAPAGQ